MPYNYRNTAFIETDFFNLDFWTHHEGAVGGHWLGSGVEGHPGVAYLDAYTFGDVTGLCSIYMDGNIYLNSVTTTQINLVMPYPLSEATNEYIARFGFCDTGIADINKGIYFLYDRLNHGINWQCVTATSAGVGTMTDTGVPVVSDWVGLQINVNPTATSVEFLIDGVSVATHTTNIPTTSTARNYLHVTANSGSPHPTLYFDYYSLRQDLATPRA